MIYSIINFFCIFVLYAIVLHLYSSVGYLKKKIDLNDNNVVNISKVINENNNILETKLRKSN